jgi:hypothetical protein
MIKTIVFPRGGGGNWLSNLIHRLETGCPAQEQTDPSVGLTYDGQKRTNSVKFRHLYDIKSTGQTEYYVDDGVPYLLFSTACAFNLYLNDSVKVRMNPRFENNIVELPWIDQFFVLSDSARYLLTDQQYANNYYRCIDLDLEKVFTDPESFVVDLFAYLDSLDLVYQPDRDYAVASCQQFAKTCPNPANYLDQWTCTEWLAWSHTLLNINNIEIPADLQLCNNLHEVSALLMPFRDFCLTNTNGKYFTWK